MVESDYQDKLEAHLNIILYFPAHQFFAQTSCDNNSNDNATKTKQKQQRITRSYNPVHNFLENNSFLVIFRNGETASSAECSAAFGKYVGRVMNVENALVQVSLMFALWNK